VKSHENDRFKFLLASVRGIMFFGTPHRGSSLATWGKILAKIGSAASLGTVVNTRLSKDLESQSNVLLEISKSFVHRAEYLQIFSFYETDKMSLLNSRVDAILSFEAGGWYILIDQDLGCGRGVGCSRISP
jgi:protein SERAC1